ncbi:MAG: hypothetical protein V4662_27045 [Verrucomicrobiota bacterium]
MAPPASDDDPYLDRVNLVLQGWDAESSLSMELDDELQRFLANKFRGNIEQGTLARQDLTDAVQETLVKVFNSQEQRTLREWRRTGKLISLLRTTAMRIVFARLDDPSDGHAGITGHDDKLADPKDSLEALLAVPEKLASLVKMIRDQGADKPRYAALIQLRKLGAAQKTSALLWGQKDDYACQQIRILDNKRKNCLGVSGDLELHRLLHRHPEVACGRMPGERSAFPRLTDEEKAELRTIARSALRTDELAGQVRTVWRTTEALISIHAALIAEGRRSGAKKAAPPPNHKPEVMQRALSEVLTAVTQVKGGDHAQAMLGRALEQAVPAHLTAYASMSETEKLDFTAVFADLITATRWQSRLWQDEHAIDWLAICLVPAHTPARLTRRNTIPADPNLKCVRSDLLKALERVAGNLEPLDYQAHISSSMEVLHELLLQATRATGATLWMKSQRLRALQAVFNPAESSHGGIVGQTQPLNEGIISWVHTKDRSIFYTVGEKTPENPEGLSGHPGNTRPNAHSKRMDQKLGHLTQAMVAIPFHCCGENRGVLSLVRTGSQATRFNKEDLARLEAFAATLRLTLEKSILDALLG